MYHKASEKMFSLLHVYDLMEVRGCSTELDFDPSQPEPPAPPAPSALPSTWRRTSQLSYAVLRRLHLNPTQAIIMDYIVELRRQTVRWCPSKGSVLLFYICFISIVLSLLNSLILLPLIVVLFLWFPSSGFDEAPCSSGFERSCRNKVYYYCYY